MNDTTIHLISGVEFDYADPMACESITEHDVAHALARITRYSGHCAAEWSVAQHTLLVYQLVHGWYKQPPLAYAALHHDDVEFVTFDWPTPLKNFVRSKGFDYSRQLERPIETALAYHIGLVIDDLHGGVVKDADNAAYEVEVHALKPEGHASSEKLDDDLMAYGLVWLTQLVDMDVPAVELMWRRVNAAWRRQEGMDDGPH